jgi:hypothetical protein
VAIDDTTDLRNYTGNENYPTYLFYVAPDSAPLNQSQAVTLETQTFSKITNPDGHFYTYDAFYLR